MNFISNTTNKVERRPSGPRTSGFIPLICLYLELFLFECRQNVFCFLCTTFLPISARNAFHFYTDIITVLSIQICFTFLPRRFPQWPWKYMLRPFNLLRNVVFSDHLTSRNLSAISFHHCLVQSHLVKRLRVCVYWQKYSMTVWILSLCEFLHWLYMFCCWSPISNLCFTFLHVLHFVLHSQLIPCYTRRKV
jgi:hypothetical protein